MQELKIADRVLSKKMNKLIKVDDKWEYDVYVVTSRLTDTSTVYVIQSSKTGTVVKAHRDFLRDHMILFQERATEGHKVPTINSQMRGKTSTRRAHSDIGTRLGIW